MADQEILDKYAVTIQNPETKEAYLVEGDLFIKREYRDARELQTRVTYHKIDASNEMREDNMINMGVWAKARKTGEQVK